MRGLQFIVFLALAVSLQANAFAAIGAGAAPANQSQTNVDTGKLFEPEAGCIRTYTYKNKTYPADSSRKTDGEGLRGVFKNNSEAERLLNDYQSNIKRLRWPSYFGGVGVASMLAGLIYSEQLQTQLGRRDTRLTMIGGGGFLVIASYLYGQYARSSNEKTLEKAVDTYNDSVGEEEKIQVNLTPLTHEAGGKIQTIVPF